MKVTPIVASRRFWCVRCGATTNDSVMKCICTNQKPYWMPIDVEIHGNVELGEGVQIAGPTDINGNDSEIVIGDGCDIAAFCTITCADSHLRCIGKSDVIERRPIMIGSRVFVGQGAIILGGCTIGDGAVIGAGVVLAKGSQVTAGAVIREAGQSQR